MNSPFIPYERLVIDTRLSVRQLTESLSSIIEPPARSFRLLRSANSEKSFEGAVRVDHFKIHRISAGRNSFLPIIKGRFAASAKGTRITVALSLHPLVIGFSVLWCAGVGTVMTASILNSEPRKSIGLIAMLIFLYLISIFSFRLEANTAKRLLVDAIALAESRQAASGESDLVSAPQ